MRLETTSETIPKTFIGFCAWLGVDLTEGQKEFARVCYDGEEPKDHGIFGSEGNIADTARSVVVAVCGARSGKSYVLIGLRLLWGALVRDLSVLAPGERGVALIVAPDLRLGRQALSYIKGAVESKPELKALVQSENADAITLLRPDAKLVSIEALPATRGGSALRGRSLTDAALDETAFFRDDSHTVNDVELFKAVTPRVVRGGQVIVASTPWAKVGLLWDLFTANYGKHAFAIAAHAPTIKMRDTEETRGIIDRERQRDPDNARREYDAEFMSSNPHSFFDSSAIYGAIKEYEFPELPKPGATVIAGADFGFISDSSALVIVHRYADLYVVGDIIELKPNGEPLKPSEVVATFAQHLKAHGATYVLADSHHRESIREHLLRYQLGLVPCDETPSEVYQRAKQLFREGKVKMPNNKRLIRQLEEVEALPTSGGRLTMRSPRNAGGGHGDIVSALVLALFRASGYTVSAPLPKQGTPEWEESERDKRRAKLIGKQQERSVWARR
jgi:hypothetical protein